MESKGVNYKVSLFRKIDGASGDNNNEQVEIRRFSVDDDVSSSYEYLTKKLAEIFPILRQRLGTVTWTDSEGEHVTIKSDDELVIALTEMIGPLYRLSVVYGSEQPRDERSEKSGVGVGCNAEGDSHPGVVCDGCDKPVAGFRYKCLQCPDYDLCGLCETNGLHAGHNMMRFGAPDRLFPRHFFSRMGKIHERMAKRAARNAAEDEEEEQPRLPEGGCGGPRGGWLGPRGGGGGRCGWRGGRGAGPRVFDSMMKGWAGGEDMFGHVAARAAAAAHAAAAATVHAGAMADHVKRHEEAVNKDKEGAAVSGGDFLANVGQLVADALDPFGIDVVKINVERQGKKTSVAGVKDKQEEPKADAGAMDKEDPETGDAAGPKDKEDQAVDVGKEGKRTVVDEAEGKQEEEPKAADDSKEQRQQGSDDKVEGAKAASSLDNSLEDKDDFEWTVVDKESQEAAAAKEVVVPIKVQGKEPNEGGAKPKANGAALYPKLPEAKGEENKPSAPVVAKHDDPRIQVALQAMMNMGFKNEGGWLTQLLEAKNGDIGKVLDALQPVTPVRK